MDLDRWASWPHGPANTSAWPIPGGQLPWVAIEKEYRFDADDGTRTLAEFFDGRSQLLLYHFMLARQDKGKFCVRLVRDEPCVLFDTLAFPAGQV